MTVEQIVIFSAAAIFFPSAYFILRFIKKRDEKGKLELEHALDIFDFSKKPFAKVYIDNIHKEGHQLARRVKINPDLFNELSVGIIFPSETEFHIRKRNRSATLPPLKNYTDLERYCWVTGPNKTKLEKLLSHETFLQVADKLFSLGCNYIYLEMGIVAKWQPFHPLEYSDKGFTEAAADSLIELFKYFESQGCFNPTHKQIPVYMQIAIGWGLIGLYYWFF